MAEFSQDRLSDAAPPIKRTPPFFGVKVGCLVEVLANVAWVDFNGNPAGPRPARSAVDLPARPGSGVQVVLQFEDGDLARPIITGVLRPTALDQMLTDAGPSEPAARGAQETAEARVDGRRVELEGAEEVVLRSGKASITLRRNGRVVIRGVYVETRASGTNRIKGGSVAIN